MGLSNEFVFEMVKYLKLWNIRIEMVFGSLNRYLKLIVKSKKAILFYKSNLIFNHLRDGNFVSKLCFQGSIIWKYYIQEFWFLNILLWKPYYFGKEYILENKMTLYWFGPKWYRIDLGF